MSEGKKPISNIYRKYPIGTLLRCKWAGREFDAVVAEPIKFGDDNREILCVVPEIKFKHQRYVTNGQHGTCENDIVRVIRKPMKKVDLLDEDLFTL